MFSIKKTGRHNQVTICGIKFKFRTSIERELQERQHEFERMLDRFERMLYRTVPQANLRRIALITNEHCNLNCQCCNSFAPLAEPEFTSVKTFEKDVKRLSELSFGHIDIINLVGGEPLLHPNFIELAAIARKYFPNTQIDIITNGILLPSQSSEFYQSLARNNVALTPTKYPIKVNWDKVKADCDKYGVTLKFHDNTDEKQKNSFIEPLDLKGGQDPTKSFLNCPQVGNCTVLKNGRMSACSFCRFAKHFSKYFNKHLVFSELDTIDIHKAKDMNEILCFLAKPIPFCKYCNKKEDFLFEEDIPWKVSRKKIEEWTDPNYCGY